MGVSLVHLIITSSMTSNPPIYTRPLGQLQGRYGSSASQQAGCLLSWRGPWWDLAKPVLWRELGFYGKHALPTAPDLKALPTHTEAFFRSCPSSDLEQGPIDI